MRHILSLAWVVAIRLGWLTRDPPVAASLALGWQAYPVFLACFPSHLNFKVFFYKMKITVKYLILLMSKEVVKV